MKEQSIYFRPSDVGKFYPISRTTLWRWAKEKKIDVREVGASRFVSHEQMRAVIEGRDSDGGQEREE